MCKIFGFPTEFTEIIAADIFGGFSCFKGFFIFLEGRAGENSFKVVEKGR